MSQSADHLYQLPLAEFTTARNALAKSAGKDGAAIRSLQKPSLPAWAVNQLYWKRRKTFDRLLEAAKRLRVEHGRQLAGRTADVADAERAHQGALSAAVADTRGLLDAAGESATPATIVAVTETLRALSGRDDHGRLTHALKPLGLEALAGLLPRSGAAMARLVEAPPRPKPKTPPARRRELHLARAAERRARAALVKAEAGLARAQRERARLQAELDDTTVQRDRLVMDVEARRKDADRAAAERQRLEFLAGAKTQARRATCRARP